MYATLLQLHSVFRWIVLLALLVTIVRSTIRATKGSTFSRIDNLLRHNTATIAHIQLVIGIMLYSQSPIVKYFWQNLKEGSQITDMLFFGLIHIGLMMTAIVVITIGSAKAKRVQADPDKFKTILVWFSIGLAIILIAVPWPFSPLSNRPYFR